MSSVFERYANIVKNEYDYYPVFPPDYPIALGDFGSLENGRFKRKGNIKKFGLKIKKLTGEGFDKIDFKLGIDFSASLIPSVTVPGMFEANLKIAFGDSSNVFFSFNECKSSIIDNYLELENKIIELYNNNEWDKNYYIITEFLEVERSTVVLADNNESEIAFEVAVPLGANIPIPQLKADFLDGEINANESYSSGISTKIIAKTGLKPLIQLAQLTGGFFIPPTLKSVDQLELGDAYEFKTKSASLKLEKIKAGDIE